MTKIAQNLLKEIQTRLDDINFHVLSETRMEAFFEMQFRSRIDGVHDKIRKLQCNEDSLGDGGNTKIGCKERLDSELFLHPHDGFFCCIPVGCQFPQCTLSVAYCLWYFGDQVKKIGPLTFLGWL